MVFDQVIGDLAETKGIALQGNGAIAFKRAIVRNGFAVNIRRCLRFGQGNIFFAAYSQGQSVIWNKIFALQFSDMKPCTQDFDAFQVGNDIRNEGELVAKKGVGHQIIAEFIHKSFDRRKAALIGSGECAKLGHGIIGIDSFLKKGDKMALSADSVRPEMQHTIRRISCLRQRKRRQREIGVTGKKS